MNIAVLEMNIVEFNVLCDGAGLRGYVQSHEYIYTYTYTSDMSIALID